MKNYSKNGAALAGALLTCALIASFVTVFASKPYAPKINLPEKLQDRDLWLSVVNQWKIPDEKAVAVPAYPGAHVVACVGASTMKSNGVETTTLPVITLATEDDQSAVAAFFKKELTDWYYKNAFDMFDVFWTGPDEFNNMDIDQSAVTPNVTILQASMAHTDFMPKAKTAIIIVYEPKK